LPKNPQRPRSVESEFGFKWEPPKRKDSTETTEALTQSERRHKEHVMTKNADDGTMNQQVFQQRAKLSLRSKARRAKFDKIGTS
jgi:hypothetical protein